MVKNKVALGLLIAIAVFISSAVVFLGISLSGVAPILKNEITITSTTYAKVYDGKKLDVDDYTLKGTLYSGDSLDIVFTEISGDVGTYENHFDVRVLNQKGKDVSANYKINTVYGTVTVSTKPIKLAVKSKTEPYDGKTLKATEYEQTGELVEGDRLEVTFSGEITDPGEVVASLYAHVYNADGRDVSANYTFTTVDGYLVKELIPLKITSSDKVDVYNGKPLKSSDYTIEGDLLDGDIEDVNVSGKITYVGTTDNEFDVVIKNGTTDVTYRYDIEKVYGILKVTEKDIVFTSKSHQDYAYDGLAHCPDNDEELVLSVDLADSDEYAVTYTNSITNAGYYVSNTFSVSITDKVTGNDVSKNYRTRFEYGKLEVQPKRLDILTQTKDKTYDGTALSYPQITILQGSILSGQAASITSAASITNAGSVENVVTIKITTPQGLNVTSNYDIRYVYGTLTVNPITIEVQASSAMRDYDGTALTSSDWYLLSGETAQGQFLHVDIEGECVGTAAATSWAENKITCDIRDITGALISDYDKNYIIKVYSGKLVVRGTEKKILYLAPQNKYLSKTEFDALGVSELTPDTDILGFEEYTTQGFTIECNIVGSLTDVGKIETYIDESSIVIKDSSSMVQTNFEYELMPGVLQIYEKEITITTESYTKEYDNTPLVHTTGVTLSDSDVEVVYTVTGSQTNVGVSFNTIEVDGIYATSDVLKQNNLIGKYKVTLSLGTLTVKRAVVVIKTGSATAKESERSTLTCSTFNVVSGLAAGHTASIKSLVTQVGVGSIKNRLEFEFKDQYGNDVSDNYIVDQAEENFGELIITAN